MMREEARRQKSIDEGLLTAAGEKETDSK